MKRVFHGKNRKNLPVAFCGAAFLLLAVIACIWVMIAARKEKRAREEIAQIFQPYQSYGLVYDEKENRLYYDGELVRYFEDIVGSSYYLKWPNQDGTVDICAQRNVSGALTGVKAASQREFSERTPSMKNAIDELEISDTICIDGFTSNIEDLINQRISEEYEVYRQYGLTYDRESERLYYNGELVGYFEDKQINHYFGPYDDSTIKIYAIRDRNEFLTGLNVSGVTND